MLDTPSNAGEHPPLLLTPDEAALKLRINHLWLKRACAAGTVQHTRVGRKIMFSQDDLQAFIESRTVRPANRVGA